MRDARFLGDPRALDRAWTTWQRLIADRTAPATPRARKREH
jgi:hypothetical protein